MLKINYERVVFIELNKIEEGIVPIYENETKEQLINARELFNVLKGNKTKTKFADWIKERLEKYKFNENSDYICFRNFTKANISGYRIENICYKICNK